MLKVTNFLTNIFFVVNFGKFPFQISRLEWPPLGPPWIYADFFFWQNKATSNWVLTGINERLIFPVKNYHFLNICQVFIFYKFEFFFILCEIWSRKVYFLVVIFSNCQKNSKIVRNGIDIRCGWEFSLLLTTKYAISITFNFALELLYFFNRFWISGANVRHFRKIMEFYAFLLFHNFNNINNVIMW